MTRHVDMIRCSYCDAYHPANFPVCSDCLPRLEAEMSIQEINVAIHNLESIPIDILKKYIDGLNTLRSKLDTLIETIKRE